MLYRFSVYIGPNHFHRWKETYYPLLSLAQQHANVKIGHSGSDVRRCRCDCIADINC